MSATPLRTISKSPPPRLAFDVLAVRRDFPILTQRIHDDKPLV